MKKKQLITLFVLLTVTALTRIWMPWNNFTPIGAIALMGGAFLGKRVLAIALPLLALFMGDIILSQISTTYSTYLFSSSFFMVYAAFGVIALIGMGLSGKMNVKRVFGGSLLAAVAFFLLSNFGAWLSFGMYPMNALGLVEAYVAGIPFFMNTLISQLLFSFILYFAVQFGLNRRPAIA